MPPPQPQTNLKLTLISTLFMLSGIFAFLLIAHPAGIGSEWVAAVLVLTPAVFIFLLLAGLTRWVVFQRLADYNQSDLYSDQRGAEPAAHPHQWLGQDTHEGCQEPQSLEHDER